MKRFVFVALCICLLAAPAMAGQGRMSGMESPYGLVEDESDFLVHPTALTRGKGIQYYANFGTSYNETTRWDLTRGDVTRGAVIRPYGQIDRSDKGHDQTANASLGVIFPVNVGRMGVIVDYDGNILSRGEYGGRSYRPRFPDGVQSIPDTIFKNSYDNISIKLLYAQPYTDKVKLGGEVGLAYKKEKNDTYEKDDHYIYDDPGAVIGLEPHDARYWEATFKGSMETMVGASKLTTSLYGGFIFTGHNWTEESGGEPAYNFFYNASTHNGNVTGYRMGLENWWRLPLSKTLTLPLLMRIEYRKKTFDGQGIVVLGVGDDYRPRDNIGYDNTEKLFNFEIGGGLEKQLGKGTLLAGGIYYAYADGDTDSMWSTSGGYRSVNFQERNEHKLTLKLAVEKEVSPVLVLRGGVSAFLGLPKEQHGSYECTEAPRGEGFSSGVHFGATNSWGVRGSAGASFKANNVIFEPYIKGGLQGYKVRNIALAGNEVDFEKNEWSVGGGLSIKF